MVDRTGYCFFNYAKFSYYFRRDVRIRTSYIYSILMLSIESKVIIFVIICMAVYFIIATPIMNDDGFHYEGFAESLAHGRLDFKTFYGFQGLSFFSVPIFWLTGSHDSIVITSAIFSFFSIFLAYLVGREFYGNRRAGIYFLILFLLMPYPYTTMMRGFQEAALLFFILLVIYGSVNRKLWTPIAWAVGGIVKPFALTLAPLFLLSTLPTSQVGNGKTVDKRHRKSVIHRWKNAIWLLIALGIGAAYLGISYYQTGHLVNNAAINSYQGNFDTGNPPPLVESFTLGLKGYLRVGANLLIHFRKIMISPLVIILGALVLWFNKGIRLRKEIIAAIVLNFLLVGSLTFSFSKYLLPMTTLFALASVSYLLKHRWLMWLVLVDSFFVFLPTWNYFGHSYWPDLFVYLLPFWVAIALFLLSERTKFQLWINDLRSRLSTGRFN